MEVNVFEIGGNYGYRVWISEDSLKVLEINYEDGRQGGTLERSGDGITECDFDYLKKAEPFLYNEIIKVKNGEIHNKYYVVNDHGNFGPFEKWELDYEHNKRIFLIEGAKIEISNYKRHRVFSF